MKEERAPSRFRWGCFGLFVAVFISCASIWWLGATNPYSARIRPEAWRISWNSAQEKLFLAIESEDSFYGLEKDGHITCELNGNNEAQGFGQSLTEEQHASLKNHYKDIRQITPLDDDVLILITYYPVEFIGISLFSSRVILLRNFNYDTALTADARTFYQAVLGCNNSQSKFIFCGGLFIVCATISVTKICGLRYKYLGLFAFVILLLIGFMVGCWLSGAGYPSLVREGASGYQEP
jgi:hypothetical protein